jgi:NitT/TauT family transport system permease protein
MDQPLSVAQSRKVDRASGAAPQRRRRSRRWAVRGEIGKGEALAFAALGLAVPLGLWVLISVSGVMSAVFMPGPLAVVHRFFMWVKGEGFTADLWISVYRVSMGFLVSLAIALPLALLSGTFRPVQAFLEPIMDFIRYMPAVAFIPLVMLWVGIDEGSKIAIIFIGTFFQMVLMMGENVRAVPAAQVEAAQTMGANNRELVWMVIFRSALPSLLDTSRITLGWAWTYLVVAEIVAANAGLGYAILKAQRFLQTDKIFAGILVIGLIGLVQDQLLRRLHRLCFPWLYLR